MMYAIFERVSSILLAMLAGIGILHIATLLGMVGAII